MGQAIFYCGACGHCVLDREIDEGRAVKIQNEICCEKCKPEVAQPSCPDSVVDGDLLEEVRPEPSSARLKTVVLPPYRSSPRIHSWRRRIPRAMRFYLPRILWGAILGFVIVATFVFALFYICNRTHPASRTVPGGNPTNTTP